MEEIIWSNAYSVGVPSIDEQHKNIIQIINRLIVASNTSSKTESVPEVLAEMLKYAKEHLAYEELLLQKHGYPDFENHKSKHVAYVENIVKFSTEAISEQQSDSKKLLAYLHKWWTNHILHEDMQYSEYLQKKNIA